MRAFLSLFIAAATVSTVSGFGLSPRQNPYPACAQPCIANAQLGNCSAQEIQCLCTEQSFIISTTQCFDSSCSGSDLASAISIAQQVCAAAGVTLTSSVPFPTSTSPSSANATTPTSSAKPSASTSAKPNSAASNAFNMIGGAAALGLAALMV